MPYQISSGRPAWRCVATAVLAMTALTPIATALAAAPTVDALPQVVVKFADLDVATDSGAATLLRRIEAAAEQICGSPHARQPLERLVHVQQCNTQAVARAVTELGAPKVTLVYRARYQPTSMG